jgi:hypothetical protein
VFPILDTIVDSPARRKQFEGVGEHEVPFNSFETALGVQKLIEVEDAQKHQNPLLEVGRDGVSEPCRGVALSGPRRRRPNNRLHLADRHPEEP